MNAPVAPVALKRRLNHRIGELVRTGRFSHQEIERQFLTQRLLARVFAVPNGPWVLKGGTSMLVRTPLARHSQDIDLLHTGRATHDALDELRLALARDVGDPFAFEITQTRDLGAAEGMNVTVDVRIAGLRFGAIPIDLAVGLNPYGQVDRVRPTAVSPGPAWVDGYSRVARTTTLAGALHSLAPALDLANRCIAPLLTGAVTIGSWDPHSWVWRSPGDINQGVVEPQG